VLQEVTVEESNRRGTNRHGGFFAVASCDLSSGKNLVSFRR
jgi:hypothetical protein